MRLLGNKALRLLLFAVIDICLLLYVMICKPNVFEEGEEDVLSSTSGKDINEDIYLIATKKKIALTFDDGPHGEDTEILLDGLKKRGVKASFFVLGQQCEQYPEIVKRMQKEGHLIGNHTYSHVQYTKGNEKKFIEEVEITNDIIYELTGEQVTYMRPPFGAVDESVIEELSMFPVLWDIDPLDWCTYNADTITYRVTKDAQEFGIILLHDCFDTSVEAALRIIDILLIEGYEFVTVEELLFP